MNPEKLLKKTEIIIRRAGTKVLSFYGKNYEVKNKENNSPLTEADLASNEILMTGLKQFGYPILSEEDDSDKSRFESERVWIIDPLDGTKDFIQETGEFTIMLALVEKQDDKYRPALGMIYQPVVDNLYYAIQNKGAFVINKEKKISKLQVSNKNINDEVIMLTSRSHSTDLEKKVAEELNIKKIKTFGSSLKACLIAEEKGEVNFNPAPFTWEWDVCASDIIICEAGGELTDIFGKKMKYNKKNTKNLNGYLASNGIIHKDILREIKKNL